MALQRGDVEEELDHVFFARLVDAAEQLLVTGAGLPVYAAQPVRALPVADAGGAQGVFKQAALHTRLAEGVFGGQLQLRHGVEARIDDQAHLVATVGAAVEEAEGIAGEDLRRAVAVKAALAARDLKVARDALVGADHPKGRKLRQVGRRIDLQRVVREGQLGRKDVADGDPGHGQELTVANLERQLHGLAQEGARLAEAPLIAKAGEAEPGPQPGDAGDEQQKERRGGEEEAVRHDPGYEQNGRKHNPGVAELRVLLCIDHAFAAAGQEHGGLLGDGDGHAAGDFGHDLARGAAAQARLRADVDAMGE